MTFIIALLAKKHARIFVYLTLALSVHACGFQLRGAINLSSDMSPIYLEQNSVFELAREIKSLLASNKIELVETAQQSKSQLILFNEAKSQRVLSVDGSGRAREYLLSYKVNFAITIKQKSTVENTTARNLLNQDSISVTRTWLFDPDAVLAVTNEAELLYSDMRREAARLILLKLNARSKNNVAGSNKKP